MTTKNSFIFITTFLLITIGLQAQQLAFPGAEGFGKYATGGRTGTVYHVTNLNDSGTGSFRDAVSKSNRIVVFDVAGVIKITSGIVVSSNIYIAGQTAPGEGITVYGDRITFSSADNTICRYMRFRMGVIGTSGKDAAGIANGRNMIFDHVSVSWGRDETFSINWDNKGTEPTDITIQNSIISQGLLLHSAGGLIQTNGGVTLYRNLYVDNSTRNNKVKGKNQYVNNIVYNWKNAAYIMGGDSEGSSYVNVTNNYFIKGPDNGGTPISDGNSDFHIYALDNWHDNNLDGNLNGYEIPRSEYSGGPDFQSAPFAYPEVPVWPATSLVDSLLPTVGASLPYRDLADFYVIGEVRSLGLEGEIISNESTLPIGAPSSWKLWAGSVRSDSDGDGMPDTWEEANGTNKTVNDAMVLAANGYVHIENYINSITADWSQPYLRSPLNCSSKSLTTSTITFGWFDYTRDEDGFLIERKVNGTYIEVGRTTRDADEFTLDGLQPDEKDTFRICAFNSTLKSDYIELIARSRPVEVPVLNLNTFVPDLTWSGQTSPAWDKSTSNWIKGTSASAFTDSSTVLFGSGTSGDQSVTIDGNMAVKAMVVNSASNYSFSGTGFISGTGSMNKAGKGTLKLGTSNTYTGATVIHEGTIEASSLGNGGAASSIGASSNYAFNLVMKGGKLDYTGASTTTDRNITLEETGEISVSSAGSTLTMTGTMTGAGGFIKSGAGILKVKNKIGNTYEGTTTVSGGTLQIDMNSSTDIVDVIGISNVVNLTGGTLQTISGQDANYETYTFSINVPEGKTGGFIPYRNCYLKSKVSGSGTLNFTVPYVREYIQGDWSEFTGNVNAIGAGSNSDGSQFMLNNSVGLPFARINLSGNTKIINWATTGTMRLGGLSGAAGTYLGGSSKSTDGTLMTWIVGGAGTDEVFNGIVNNDCSAKGHYAITSIIKEGTGTWRLNGNNVYSGTTTLTGGILIVNGTHTGTGKVTVQEEATLAGKGKLTAAVQIKSGGILEPGDSSIATFQVGSLTLDSLSQVNIEINKTGSSYDKVTSTGAMLYNGTLNLLITGSLALGDQFTLFTGSKHTGMFTKIIPAVPGPDMHWVFENGILRVEAGSSVTRVKVGSMTVYPNPASSYLNLIFDEPCPNGKYSIRTLAGAAVGSGCLNNQTENVDISQLQPGIYILQINDGFKEFPATKLIKQ